MVGAEQGRRGRNRACDRSPESHSIFAAAFGPTVALSLAAFDRLLLHCSDALRQLSQPSADRRQRGVVAYENMVIEVGANDERAARTADDDAIADLRPRQLNRSIASATSRQVRPQCAPAP